MLNLLRGNFYIVFVFSLIFFSGALKAEDHKYLPFGGELVSSEDIIKVLNSRPRQCPLAEKIDSYHMVLDRLRDSLKRFKCKDEAHSILGAMKKSNLPDLSNTNSATKKIVTSNNLIHSMETLSGAFNGLAGLKRRKECEGDLNGKSFLSALADAILGVTQWGVLAGDGDGIQLALGGVLFSSIIRVIDHFFNRGYNWNNHDDRILFGRINCSFYDMRFELHELGFFRLSNEQTRREEQQLKTELKEFERQRSAFVKDIETREANIERDHKDFIASKISAQEKSLYQHSKKLLEILPDSNDEMISNTKLLWLSISVPEILASLDEVPWEDSVRHNIIPPARQILEQFSMVHYFKNIRKDYSSEMEVLQTLFRYYTKFYEEERLTAVVAQWQESELPMIKQSIAEKRQKAKELATEIEDKKRRIGVLRYINSKKFYRTDDRGASELAGVYQNYDKTIHKIYGKQGGGFINALRKKLLHSHNAFEQWYGILEESGYFRQKSLTALGLNEACTRARTLVERWDQANTWGQYAFDFLITNIDLFHDLEKRKKFFGSKTTLRLRDDAYSALYAKALIDKHRRAEVSQDELHEDLDIVEQSLVVAHEKEEAYRFEYKPNYIGGLMMKTYLNFDKAKQLDEFIGQNCSEVSLF